MKQFIKHRVNQISELENVDPAWGVEIDLRSHVAVQGKLHLSHDPWKEGEDFRWWLDAFCSRKIRGPIALNTKEDGLEEAITRLMKEYGIGSYFFVDTAPPTLARKVFLEGDRHFAPRLSEFEIPEAAQNFSGKTDWLWVDCFRGRSVLVETLSKLSPSFKVCLVSPELHGASLDTIEDFKALYSLAHAVCTKNPQAWFEKCQFV